MRYKIKQSGKTKRTIEFHISKELITEELNRIYLQISKKASLPGFRVGKVPIELVKKRYKKEARDEAVKNLLADSFEKVVAESDIKILGAPEISDLEFDIEKGMSYKTTVNIKPKVRLKGYKGLNLKRVKNEIKESDVDAGINTLRETNAKFLTKTGGAAPGNYIICDVECSIEDKPLEKKENTWLYVGDDAFIPGKSLEGLKVNDEKDVEKTLPENYSKKELAGKKAKFHIRAKEIKEKILPELNDEFATTLGNFKNVGELREAIRLSIKKRSELEKRKDLENQAMKLLDKMAVFDVPQFIVDKHLESLVNETKERLKKEQFSEDKIKSMEKDFRERLKAEAIRQVRAYFILDEIANSEGIKVDDKEIEETFKIMASSSNRSIGEIRKYYEENNLIGDLREEMKQRKILDFLIENANIKDG